MKTKIKLSYDVRMVANSGIGTQIQNVLERMVRSEIFDLTLLGNPEKIAAYAPGFQGAVVDWDPPIYSLQEQRMPRQEGIILSPHYNVTLKYLSQTVVVLHDLIHLHSDEFNRPHYRLYANLMLRSVAKRARRVVTVSKFTANDFLSRFPRGLNRTLINLNGLDHKVFKKPQTAEVKAFREKYSLPESFVLTVGIGKRHKNVDFVIRSLAPLWESGELKTPLVMGGSGGRLPEYITQEFQKNNALEHIQVLPRLEVEEMRLMYAAAKLLIMPSLIEGFGFPVAEAMACGTPVLSSNMSSLPEVGGEAAVYFNPRDSRDFCDKLGNLLKDSDELKKLAGLGLKRAKVFNWSTHYENLEKILLEVERE